MVFSLSVFIVGALRFCGYALCERDCVIKLLCRYVGISNQICNMLLDVV
jgi:hypothetical protein